MSAPVITKRQKPVDQLRRMPNHPVAECARCHETAPIAARQLCDRCYAAARKDGSLADYPTTRRRFTAAELLEEYDLLASAGNTHEVICQRLGYANPYQLRTRIRTLRRGGARV